MSAPGFAPSQNASPRASSGDGCSDDELDHWWCCNPDIALCGTDVSTAKEKEINPDSPLTCVVCQDLYDAPCSLCGDA